MQFGRFLLPRRSTSYYIDTVMPVRPSVIKCRYIWFVPTCHPVSRAMRNEQKIDWHPCNNSGRRTKTQAVGTGCKWRHQSSLYELRPELSTKQTYNYVYEPLFIPWPLWLPGLHRGVPCSAPPADHVRDKFALIVVGVLGNFLGPSLTSIWHSSSERFTTVIKKRIFAPTKGPDVLLFQSIGPPGGRLKPSVFDSETVKLDFFSFIYGHRTTRGLLSSLGHIYSLRWCTAGVFTCHDHY